MADRLGALRIETFIPWETAKVEKVGIRKTAELLNQLVIVKVYRDVVPTFFLDFILSQIETLNQEFTCNIPVVILNSRETNALTLETLDASKTNVQTHSLMLEDNSPHGWCALQAEALYTLGKSGLLESFSVEEKKILFMSEAETPWTLIDLRRFSNMVDNKLDLCVEVSKIQGEGTLPVVYANEKAKPNYNLFTTINLWLDLKAASYFKVEEIFSKTAIVCAEVEDCRTEKNLNRIKLAILKALLEFPNGIRQVELIGMLDFAKQNIRRKLKSLKEDCRIVEVDGIYRITHDFGIAREEARLLEDGNAGVRIGTKKGKRALLEAEKMKARAEADKNRKAAEQKKKDFRSLANQLKACLLEDAIKASNESAQLLADEKRRLEEDVEAGIEVKEDAKKNIARLEQLYLAQLSASASCSS